jgi:uncharacterized protein involved in exopolysaccharide biosynthesis
MDLPVIDAKPSVLRDMLYGVLRHGRRVVLLTMAGGCIAYVYGVAHGASYTASARLLATPVSAGQEHGQAARNEAEILRDPALMSGLAPQLQASLPEPHGQPARLARRLGTWWRAELVQAGLARPESDNARLAAALSKALRVEALPGTDVVELRLAWRDPAFAAEVLNTMLREQHRLANGDAEASQSVVLAAARLRDAQAQLAQVDQRIAALPLVDGAAPDAGALEREKDRVASRIGAARSSADALRVDRELAARKLEAAEKAYAGGGWVDNPDAPAGSSGEAAADPVFVALLEKRARLVAKVPADFPGVHEVDTEIAQARERAYQSVHQVLGDRLHTIDDRLAALAAQSAADEGELRSLDDRLVQMEALLGTRQSAATQVADAARALDEQKRQAETAIHQAAGLRVLSGASAPEEPDWPSPVFLVWASSLAGLCLGLASAALAERHRITIDRPQDITRVLKIPVLASVPELR